jgi:asparagine synthetase B (glutamine-hydrolysing)
MCGIAGLYAFSPSAPPADRAQLRTIRDHMTALGPDGHGEWFSDNGRAAFDHRRQTMPAIAQALAPQLPRALLSKLKTGFTIPVRDWLLGDQAEVKERGLRGWARHIHGAVSAKVPA